MVMHNVNIENVKRYMEEVKRDPSKGRKVQRIEGEWNTQSGAQFSAEVQFEKGKLRLTADQPTFQGGGGSSPNPVLYCLFGLASCYASTFATIAAVEGIALKRMRVTVESGVDHRRALGLSEDPPTTGIQIKLAVESSASQGQLKDIEALALKRCPAVYCLTQPIPLTTSLEVIK